MSGLKLKAIITGASSGIGRALVKAFLDKGYQVEGIDRSSSEFNDTSAYRHHQLDVTDSVRLAALVSKPWNTARLITFWLTVQVPVKSAVSPI